MRLTSTLLAGALWSIALFALSAAQDAPGVVRQGAALIALVLGFGTAWLVPANDERQDRASFLAVVVLLFALLLLGVARVLEPAFFHLAGGGLEGAHRLRAAVANGLASLTAAALLFVLAHTLIGYEASDLGLRAVGRAMRARVGAGACACAIALFPLSRVLPPLDAPWAVLPVLVGCEEFLYRGFLQATLRDRLGRWAAWIAQASVYGAAGAFGPEPSLERAVARFLLALAAGGCSELGGHIGWAIAGRLLGALWTP